MYPDTVLHPPCLHYTGRRGTLFPAHYKGNDVIISVHLYTPILQNGACINIAHTNPVVLDTDSSDQLLWLLVQAGVNNLAGLLFLDLMSTRGSCSGGQTSKQTIPGKFKSHFLDSKT